MRRPSERLHRLIQPPILVVLPRLLPRRRAHIVRRQRPSTLRRRQAIEDEDWLDVLVLERLQVLEHLGRQRQRRSAQRRDEGLAGLGDCVLEVGMRVDAEPRVRERAERSRLRELVFPQVRCDVRQGSLGSLAHPRGLARAS